MKQFIGFLAKGVAFIVTNLPRSVQMALGSAIGRLWFDVLRIRRKIAIDNVTIAYPELSLKERTRIARASLISMGQTLVEYFSFPFLKSETIRERFEIEGEEHMINALAQGRGVIMLTLHLGNGDYALTGLSRMGYPINLISKEFKARWLNDLWFGMRKKQGTKFIAPEKSSFDILKALRRKEVVVFVLDQFMGPPVGVRTRFFGKVTGTAMGCAIISDRTKAPVLPAYTYRRRNGQAVIAFDPVMPDTLTAASPDHSLRDENIAVMTQSYTDKIESIVRRHPDQWMWIHRRWKEFRD